MENKEKIEEKNINEKQESIEENSENIEEKEIESSVPKVLEEDSKTQKEITVQEENIQEKAIQKQTQQTAVNKSKDELINRVDNIKAEVEEIYSQYKKVLDEFEKESLELAAQENQILNTTVKRSVDLLKKLNIDNLSSINDTINEIKLDNKKELLEVKYPSKGRFKGFFWGALTTMASVAALGAYGAKMANLPLNLATFSQKANLDTIVSKYLELLNLKDMPIMNGYLILGGGSLILGFIVYKIITFAQKFKNKKMVEHLEKNSQEFKEELLKNIEELKKTIEHIEKIKEVNEKYDVILQEQNAKLNRILFIEKPKELSDLHSASAIEVEETQLILDELLKLMNTPVLKDDKLNEDSIRNLKSANIVINEVIKKLY